MAQAYSDPTRAGDTYSLPDIEVFHHDCTNNADPCEMAPEDDLGAEYECYGRGWYYQYCFPGCLPDSEPIGPYDSEADAIQAAQDDASE